MTLLAGNLPQTLPVNSRSTPADKLNAFLKSSVLWKYVKTLKLSMNMRVKWQNDKFREVFPKQLLNIGNDNISGDTSSGCITFLCRVLSVCPITQSKTELVEMMVPNIVQNYRNHV